MVAGCMGFVVQPLKVALARRRAKVEEVEASCVHPSEPFLLPITTPSQATLNGLLTAGLFFFISQAKPREQLSAVRPHNSIFNPYFFISLLGQAA